MAVVATVSNHAKFKIASGDVNFGSGGDVFKVILMDSAFAFNKDTHATLADVTANQLSTGNGYTQDTKVLTGVALVEDDTNDKAAVTWDNPTWTASGGAIGPTGAYIIYDDTTTDDTVIVCVDFGTDYTINDASSIQLQNIAVSLT